MGCMRACILIILQAIVVLLILTCHLWQAITFDGWTEPMYGLMAVMSPAVSVFFVLIVVVGGWFVVNLFLAVIFQVRGLVIRTPE